MAARKRGLGRGLDALLGSSGTPRPTAQKAESTDEQDGELRSLPIDLLQRGRYQPRTGMNGDALEELANSIRSQGVVQPIVVRELETPGRYEIIAGERRWRAAQLAGLHEIPAIIRQVPDQAAIAMALIENIQREELNPMEEAQALQKTSSACWRMGTSRWDMPAPCWPCRESNRARPHVWWRANGCPSGKRNGWCVAWWLGAASRPHRPHRIPTFGGCRKSWQRNWGHRSSCNTPAGARAS